VNVLHSPVGVEHMIQLLYFAVAWKTANEELVATTFWLLR